MDLSQDERAIIQNWRDWLAQAEPVGRFADIEQLGEHLVVERFTHPEETKSADRSTPESALAAALASGRLVYFHDGTGIWAFRPRSQRPSLNNA